MWPRGVLVRVGGAPVLTALLLGLLLLAVAVVVLALHLDLRRESVSTSPAPSSALRGGKQGFRW